MNISVIIPVYNAEKFLQKAIESALQFNEVSEVILVEDRSPDNCLKICKELETKHERVKVFTHPNNENRGAGASRNLGIEKATGDYIAFLDADDFYLPNRFLKDKEVFAKNPDADGCYNAIGCYFYTEVARQQFLNGATSEITTVNPSINPSPANIFGGLLGLIPSYGYYSVDGLTLKKTFLKKSGIKFPQSSMHEDTVFNIKTAYSGILLPSEIENAVCMRGVHEENRITANNQSNENERLHKRFLMWDEIKKWSKTLQLTEKQKNHIENQTTFYRLLSEKKSSPYFFFKEVIKNPKILKHPSYIQFHKHFWGTLRFSHLLMKIRNFVIRYI